MIGATIHMTTTRPPMMFRAAQNGTTRGDPMYAIWDQSKVNGNNPSPEATPNCFMLLDLCYHSKVWMGLTRLATTTLRGANHVMTLNQLNAGNSRPGKK